MLAVLYGGGLRRSEAVALDIGDYDLETGALAIRAGKGRKDRVACLTNDARVALDAWVVLRGREPGPLFWPTDARRRLVNRRMVPQSVLDIVRQGAVQAGVQAFSLHDLRRTFIVIDRASAAPRKTRAYRRRDGSPCLRQGPWRAPTTSGSPRRPPLPR